MHSARSRCIRASLGRTDPRVATAPRTGPPSGQGWGEGGRKRAGAPPHTKIGVRPSWSGAFEASRALPLSVSDFEVSPLGDGKGSRGSSGRRRGDLYHSAQWSGLEPGRGREHRRIPSHGGSWAALGHLVARGSVLPLPTPMKACSEALYPTKRQGGSKRTAPTACLARALPVLSHLDLATTLFGARFYG